MHIVVKLPPHDRVLLLACPLRYFCRYISEDFLSRYDAVAVSVGSPLIRYWVKSAFLFLSATGFAGVPIFFFDVIVREVFPEARPSPLFLPSLPQHLSPLA